MGLARLLLRGYCEDDILNPEPHPDSDIKCHGQLQHLIDGNDPNENLVSNRSQSDNILGFYPLLLLLQIKVTRQRMNSE